MPLPQPSSITFSGHRLNLLSFSGHPAWAWIFISELSFIYPRTLWNMEVTSCFRLASGLTIFSYLCSSPQMPCLVDSSTRLSTPSRLPPLSGQQRILLTNIQSQSSTPSRPLFFSRALYSRSFSCRQFLPTKLPYLQHFNVAPNAFFAVPLLGTPLPQPLSITFLGHRLNLSSFSGHPAWAWIFISELSFIYP
jgi:hypothetical protein